MENICVRTVGIFVTMSCPLKCKHCGAVVPYCTSSYNPSVDYLKSEIDSVFNIIDRAESFILCGGEPFLRAVGGDTALGEIIAYLCEEYADNFEEILFITSGTTVPNDFTCEFLKRISSVKPIRVVIDDYGKHSFKLHEVDKKLRIYGLEPEIRDYAVDIHCGGWRDAYPLDAGSIHNYEYSQKLFEKCAVPHKLGYCIVARSGIMTFCSTTDVRFLCSQIDKSHEDIIDLHGDREIMREKVKRILSMSEPLETCMWCKDGLSDETKRIIPAQQATLEEIKEFQNKYEMRL